MSPLIVEKTILLVGESNPYSTNPDDALLPYPARSAGYRLCRRILGMSRKDYVRTFVRRNLVQGSRWSVREARRTVSLLSSDWAGPVILLGAKVWHAWASTTALAAKPSNPWRPFQIVEEGDRTILTLPHPSGRSRLWNDRAAVERAREAVARLVPWLAGALGEGDA